jgi:hypothetical protein
VSDRGSPGPDGGHESFGVVTRETPIYDGLVREMNALMAELEVDEKSDDPAGDLEIRAWEIIRARTSSTALLLLARDELGLLFARTVLGPLGGEAPRSIADCPASVAWDDWYLFWMVVSYPSVYKLRFDGSDWSEEDNINLVFFCAVNQIHGTWDTAVAVTVDTVDEEWAEGGQAS